MIKPFIYLASPLAHPDPPVRANRCQYASAVACLLMRVGFPIFSPLSHSFLINAHDPEGQITHEAWMEADFRVLPYCDILAVLCLPGWKESKGVGLEIDYATKANKLSVLIPVGVPTMSADAIVRFAQQHYVSPQVH